MQNVVSHLYSKRSVQPVHIYFCAHSVAFFVCAVFVTFKCSRHMRPILRPNRCQLLLSFWKQLINKISLETVSQEIGCSESHNSNLSKTFSTKSLRNTSSTHCIFSLIVCKYYWGHDFEKKKPTKLFHIIVLRLISSFSMVYPLGPIGILPWLIMLGEKSQYSSESWAYLKIATASSIFPDRG